MYFCYTHLLQYLRNIHRKWCCGG
jgi:iron-sulfur cluster repair protein YtfE (RIC family)